MRMKFVGIPQGQSTFFGAGGVRIERYSEKRGLTPRVQAGYRGRAAV